MSPLKTLIILTQRNVDGKWRRIALCQTSSTAPSFHQVCHLRNLADRSTVRRQTGLMTKVRNCLLLIHQRRSNGVKLLNHHHKVIQQCSIYRQGYSHNNSINLGTNSFFVVPRPIFSVELIFAWAIFVSCIFNEIICIFAKNSNFSYFAA